MGLELFDPTRHHIGLGPSIDELYGYIISGAYSKREQEFGAPTAYGGTSDVFAPPTLSRWTMDDFSGGAYQYTYGKDKAMYLDSGNLLLSQFDRSVRTVPPMSAVFLRNVGGAAPLTTFAAGGFLFAIWQTKIRRWKISDGTLTEVDWPGAYGAIRDCAYDRASGTILFLVDAGIIRYNKTTLDLPPAPEVTAYNFPAKVKGTAQGFCVSDGYVVFATGGTAWRLDIPDDRENNPVDADWTRIGPLPGKWRAARSINGLTYILLNDDDGRTQLVAFDGTRILPITEFPYNFIGQSLEVYGGRVYVGGSARDIDGTDRYASFYEVTGQSLRLVRTWQPQVISNVDGSRPRSIYSFTVHEGLLFFGEQGRGLVAYDIATDSIVPSSRLQPPDGVREFRDVVSYRERIWAWIRHPLDPAQDGWHRISEAADVTAGRLTSFYGELVTSDFAEQPDRLKRWSQLRVMSRNEGYPVNVSYSVDGGANWTDLDGDPLSANVHDYDLSDVPPSRQIRLRIRLQRGNNVNSFSELVSFTLAFAFLDTGKRAWTFSLTSAELVEDASGASDRSDIHDIASTLWSWKMQGIPLSFRDLNGDLVQVFLQSLVENQPVVLPPVDYVTEDGDTGSAREAFFTVSLLEV